MHQSRRPAVLRGFAAATVAIFVALAGHVTGGGEMPGLLGIAVPWVLSFMVSVLLAGRRLSVIRLSISVALSQFLFHTLFVLGAITPTMSSGHVHGAVALPPEAAFLGTGSPSGSMWLAHIAAAAVTVLALHRGERLLIAARDLAQQSIDWLRRRIDSALVAPRIPSASRLVVISSDAVAHDIRLLTPLRGRAPPLGVSA